MDETLFERVFDYVLLDGNDFLMDEVSEKI